MHCCPEFLISRKDAKNAEAAKKSNLMRIIYEYRGIFWALRLGFPVEG